MWIFVTASSITLRQAMTRMIVKLQKNSSVRLLGPRSIPRLVRWQVPRICSRESQGCLAKGVGQLSEPGTDCRVDTERMIVHWVVATVVRLLDTRCAAD